MYGTETERLVGTVWHHLDRAEQNKYITYFWLLLYSTDQQQGKHLPQTFRCCPTSCPQLTTFLSRDGDPVCIHPEGEHVGKGEQLVGMVNLPEATIIELKLSIDKKPTDKQLNVLLEPS